MKIIRPTTLTDAMLISSSVAETEYPAWASGTTYAAGDLRIKAHRIWESAQAGNLNHDPVTDTGTWWIDTGPTNQRGMFDDKVGSETTAADGLTVTLAPGRIDALALICDAASVTVEQKIGARTIYSRTTSMIDNSNITNMYEYWVEPIRQRTTLALLDLMPLGEAETVITLERPGGTVSCGLGVVGLQADLGETESSAKISCRSTAKPAPDRYNRIYLKKGNLANRISCRMLFKSAQTDRMRSVLREVEDTAIIWIAEPDSYDSLMLYGFASDWDITLAYNEWSYLETFLEGMI